MQATRREQCRSNANARAFKHRPIAMLLRTASVPALMLTLQVGQAQTTNAATVQDDDVIDVSISQSLRYDSNVYRLSGSRNPPDEDSRGDFISVTSAAVDFDKTFGRQRLRANASGSAVRFLDFDQLNYNAHNLKAGWTSGFGSASEAGVDYERYRTATDFSDRENFERNLVTDDRVTGRLGLRVFGDWLAVGSVTVGKSRNSAEVEQAGDNRNRAVDAGVRYAPRTGNWVDVRYRRAIYDYEDAAVTANGVPAFSDNDFEQSEVRVTALYQPTYATTFEASLGHLKRDHDELTHRDFQGWVGYFEYTWRVSDDTRIATRLTRELGAINDASATYARTTGLAVRPSWQASGKVLLGGVLSVRHRDYDGNQAGGADSPQREETLYTLGATANYQVSYRFSLEGAARYDWRTSNDSDARYSAYLLGVTARYRF